MERAGCQGEVVVSRVGSRAGHWVGLGQVDEGGGAGQQGGGAWKGQGEAVSRVGGLGEGASGKGRAGGGSI